MTSCPATVTEWADPGHPLDPCGSEAYALAWLRQGESGTNAAGRRGRSMPRRRLLVLGRSPLLVREGFYPCADVRAVLRRQYREHE